MIKTNRNKKRYEIICAACNSIFVSSRSDAKCCGPACRQRIKRNSAPLPYSFAPKKEGYIYAATAPGYPIKIGMTTTKIRLRELDLRHIFKCPELKIVHTRAVDDTVAHEMRVHGRFWDKHLGREWFDITLDEAISCINEV